MPNKGLAAQREENRDDQQQLKSLSFPVKQCLGAVLSAQPCWQDVSQVRHSVGVF